MAFKYWMVGKERVHIVERYGSTVLVEYVQSGRQSSVSASLLRSCTAKPKIPKTLKNNSPQKNKPNEQTSLDL